MHHPAPHTGQLVAPIAPQARHDTVLYSMRKNDWELSLRPFDLNRDTGILQQWVKMVYPGKSDMPDQVFVQTIDLIAQSDFAQAFMVLEKGVPVTYVEVTKASHHELALSMECQPGDYLVSFPLPESIQPELQKAILEMSVAYFLLFEEVKRVLMLGNKEEGKWLQEAGFGVVEGVAVRTRGVYMYGYGMNTTRKA